MNDAAPYRRLWQRVVLQAILDSANQTFGGAHPGRAAVEQHRARQWLDKPGRDFDRVCELAGLDPTAVTKAWRAGRLTPEALGRLLTRTHFAALFRPVQKEPAHVKKF